MRVERTVVCLPKLNPVHVPSNFSRSSLAVRAGIKTGRLQTLSATQFSTAPGYGHTEQREKGGDQNLSARVDEREFFVVCKSMRS